MEDWNSLVVDEEIDDEVFFGVGDKNVEDGVVVFEGEAVEDGGEFAGIFMFLKRRANNFLRTVITAAKITKNS